MIFKKYRLKEKEVKRVLWKWKPFFSYWIVLNSLINKFENNRFAIIIWAKSVNNNITRNYFRRLFHDIVKDKIKKEVVNWKYKDFVFVIKKQTKLDKNNKKTILSFMSDLNFILNKVFKKK